jgi:glutamate decarboxylase
MPPSREDLVIQRILIRHGFTQQMADQLLVEMEDALGHFDQHPVDVALAGAGAGAHDHSGR